LALHKVQVLLCVLAMMGFRFSPKHENQEEDIQALLKL